MINQLWPEQFADAPLSVRWNVKLDATSDLGGMSENMLTSESGDGYGSIHNAVEGSTEPA